MREAKARDNMKKIKIVAMLVAAMFVGLAATTISGAAELEGGIRVYVDGFIGVVTPEKNFTEDQENQTVTFLVNVTTTPDGNPDNATYKVEDKLKINLDIIDRDTRESFILPRSLFFGYILARDIENVPLLPLFGDHGFFNRLFPVKKLFNSVNIVNSTLAGGRINNISIPMNYKINNATFNNGDSFENMTLHLYTMGFLPGNTNGLSEKIPIIAHMKIKLKIEYDQKL